LKLPEFASSVDATPARETPGRASIVNSCVNTTGRPGPSVDGFTATGTTVAHASGLPRDGVHVRLACLKSTIARQDDQSIDPKADRRSWRENPPFSRDFPGMSGKLASDGIAACKPRPKGRTVLGSSWLPIVVAGNHPPGSTVPIVWAESA